MKIYGLVVELEQAKAALVRRIGCKPEPAPPGGRRRKSHRAQVFTTRKMPLLATALQVSPVSCAMHQIYRGLRRLAAVEKTTGRETQRQQRRAGQERGAQGQGTGDVWYRNCMAACPWEDGTGGSGGGQDAVRPGPGAQAGWVGGWENWGTTGFIFWIEKEHRVA